MRHPAATKITPVLKAARRVVLATHAEPDGDAVGSVLGLAYGLRAWGVEAAIWPLEPPPTRYCFLPGFDEVENARAFAWRDGDVAVALDSADLGRLPSEVASFAEAGGTIIDVDHHASNRGFGSMDWVEPAAPATAAQVWELLGATGGDFPAEAALCLYVGLVTDTGNFTYSNTNDWAFEMAADLVRRGVSPSDVESDLYRRYPLAYMKILGAALGVMERRGGVVFMAVTQEALRRAGAEIQQTEGLVDYARRVEGCRVGILFREVEGGVRISFRAAEDLDVSGLALARGGGGHPAAAGCFVAGPLAEVRDAVLAEVEEWLKSKPAA
ncbi:MAG: DHH family phosphoesterase [Candidatus Zixiibacteriota bacterium]|jgi:phosphoesterase RecJ-like protein